MTARFCLQKNQMPEGEADHSHQHANCHQSNLPFELNSANVAPIYQSI